MNSKEKLNAELKRLLAITTTDGIKERFTSIIELIEAGGNAELEDSMSNTPLMIACTHKDSKLVRYLINKGVDVNHQNRYGYSALMLATMYCGKRVSKILIQAGADVTLKSEIGDDAIKIATVNNYPSLGLLKEALIAQAELAEVAGSEERADLVSDVFNMGRM